MAGRRTVSPRRPRRRALQIGAVCDDVVVALVVVVVAWAAACPAPPSSTAPATTPAATPFDTRNIPSLHLRAPGLSGRPRVLWVRARTSPAHRAGSA